MKANETLTTSRSVLLLVDYINPLDFPGADALARRALPAARATAKLKRRMERQGCVSIYANDNYGVWQSEFGELLEKCKALPGVRGEIANLLAPGPNDLTVLKPRHSAFHSTPLDLLLKGLKTRELVIAGLAFDICVHLTAMDAFLHGYEVWVPSDCSAVETKEWERQSIEHMRRVLRCSIRASSTPRRQKSQL
jgi:nicotinamidase-related amidase